MSIIERDRALKLFINGGNMRAAPSAFDLQRLDSYDRKYKLKEKDAGATSS